MNKRPNRLKGINKNLNNFVIVILLTNNKAKENQTGYWLCTLRIRENVNPKGRSDAKDRTKQVLESGNKTKRSMFRKFQTLSP